MFGGELQGRARHAGYADAPFCGSREIDRIGARAEPLDQLEFGIGIHEGAIDRAATENENVRIAALAQSTLADMGMSDTPSL